MAAQQHTKFQFHYLHTKRALLNELQKAIAMELSHQATTDYLIGAISEIYPTIDEPELTRMHEKVETDLFHLFQAYNVSGPLESLPLWLDLSNHIVHKEPRPEKPQSSLSESFSTRYPAKRTSKA